MKKAIITLAAGLFMSSLSMAFTPSNAATDGVITLPCGKKVVRQVALFDKKSNFYNIAKGIKAKDVGTPGYGDSAN